MTSATLACRPLLLSGNAQTTFSNTSHPLRLAVIGSVYTLGSEMQTITDRFLIGYPHNGDWHVPNVQVVSMYVDQRSKGVEQRTANAAQQNAQNSQRSQGRPRD